ncbi:hypothetical protein H2201_000193 [Coniosporium apollinis]|uniref:Transcription factor domain-containing protein n=1 Tax=Coniosporium apollinis TaxID=61459 RepID=A0ABQ9P623_9PEZI|nr:hypothetical protein H2201_000193 [Coniosporium apollinis]
MQPLRTPLFAPRFAEEHVSPTQVLDEAAVEYEDDDYYDVNSDDEMDMTPDQMTAIGGKQKDLGLIMELHRQSTSDLSVRRYDSFIYEGILDYYRAERVANPLRNEKTARVFAHFINSTGPSLSISERKARNTSALFSESPVPMSQQSLWTYTLPMMALNHQGLLHAMLALASLHIAKLQGASVTPSFKHYAYALKRIHHCVGHPKKRHQVTTLAASLLLGFYEVMTADHLKWSSHLFGAKQLLVEIDYQGMTKEYRRQKAKKAAHEQNFARDNPELLIQQRQLARPYSLNDDLPDEGLVSTLIGRKLRYDEYGQIIEEPGSNPPPTNSIPQPFDINKYEIFQDLFWWYCKQDVFQSIVSGNRLLMDYSRWSDCPPRGPIGKGQAVFATYDHLMLLAGRVADFAARDRVRKQKAVEAMGGHWRPQPGMPMGPPPGTPRAPPGVFTPGGPPPGFPMGPPGGAMGAPHVSPTGPAPGHPSEFPSGNPMASSPMTPAGPYGSGFPASMPPTNGAPYPPHSAGFPGQQMPQPPPTGPQMPPQMPPQRPPGPIQMPSFYGMAPIATPTVMPPSYASNKRKRSPETPSPKSDIIDLEAATASALEEWQQIMHALKAFHARLGPAYQPLPPEHHQPISTPFGEALQYRSYDIGVVWAHYHMTHIIAIRAHPHMPPAAMVAAGVAAAATAGLANEIGRITAGITPTPGNTPLNPSLGGCLIESTMPLFFAGIQYQDAAQRGWLVSRILDIEARTGWASAGLIARGCETAWVKAAAMGRGPPYYQKNDENSSDDRLAGRVVRDMSAEPPKELTDRRCIWTNAGTRVHWAMGLLAAEEDVGDSPPAGSPTGHSPH